LAERTRRVKKSRYNERQQALRGLTVREFSRDHYIAIKGLSVSTIGLVNDLLGHMSRCRGQTAVRELNDELLYELRDYFLTQIADGEMGAANANKNLRQLKAVGNHAFKERLLKAKLTFNAFLPETKPQPKALSPEEYWRIGDAARKVNGFVGRVPAGLWWYAWYLTMSRIGNRLTALMLSERGDYQHGVLHLKAENQKQDEDQRLELPVYARPAIEDLLAAHDEPRLFPWPYDRAQPGRRSTWKRLFTHFRQKILVPAGITLKPGVLTRVFRQTVATRIDSLGGDASLQLGHSSQAITDKYYKDKSQAPVIKGALLIPEDRPPAPPPGKQTFLFQKDAKG
jgi:integrase